MPGKLKISFDIPFDQETEDPQEVLDTLKETIENELVWECDNFNYKYTEVTE